MQFDPQNLLMENVEWFRRKKLKIQKSLLSRICVWSGLALAVICLVIPSQASAGGVDVAIGLNFGFPGYYVAPPPPVVVQQAPVYVEPPAVVVQPNPVVIYRQPVVVVPAPRAYYDGHIPPGHAKKHHKHYKQGRYERNY